MKQKCFIVIIAILACASCRQNIRQVQCADINVPAAKCIESSYGNKNRFTLIYSSDTLRFIIDSRDKTDTIFYRHNMFCRTINTSISGVVNFYMFSRNDTVFNYYIIDIINASDYSKPVFLQLGHHHILESYFGDIPLAYQRNVEQNLQSASPGGIIDKQFGITKKDSLLQWQLMGSYRF